MDLLALLPSWTTALRAERKSVQTVESYGLGVTLFARWCAEQGHVAALDRSLVRAWVTHLLDSGAAPATARTRQMALKRFSAWLVEEELADSDPLLGLKPPALDMSVVPSLTDDELKRLLVACEGKSFIDRRDEALVRLMAETGMRVGEALALTLDDVDTVRGLAVIRRGKGGRGRVAPFGPQTGRALDRYVRLRRKHKLAHTETFWLGGGGQGFGYHAADKALKIRAELADLKNFHCHLLRHTAASRWLAAGGSEGGLMAVAGWRSRSMVDRYTRSTAADRAAVEARSLGLGDL